MINRIFDLQFSKLSLVWFQFLLVAIVLLIYSTDISLSINRVIVYLLLYLVFWFGRRLFRKLNNVYIFLTVLIGITTVLCFIAGALLIVPEYAKYIPPMNIIYPTFGHNHLAEWLLIVIPIAWWYAIFSEK